MEVKPKGFNAQTPGSSLGDFNAGMDQRCAQGSSPGVPFSLHAPGSRAGGSLSLDQGPPEGWGLFYRGKALDSQHNPELLAGKAVAWLGTSVRHPSHRIPGSPGLEKSSRMCLMPTLSLALSATSKPCSDTSRDGRSNPSSVSNP